LDEAGPENVGPKIPECQKVENPGPQNAGSQQLSDSSLKQCQYSTDISVMNAA